MAHLLLSSLKMVTQRGFDARILISRLAQFTSNLCCFKHVILVSGAHNVHFRTEITVLNPQN